MSHEAKEELKRADHLIHITLKYTRTTDVIISILQRFVSAIEAEMKDILEIAKEKKHITQIEPSPKLKTQQLRKLFKNSEEINILIDFYFLLRRIIKAEHSKKDEFRKNITLYAIDDSGIFAEINAETIKEYFKKVEDLINYMDEYISLLKQKRKK